MTSILNLIRPEAERRGLADGDLVDIIVHEGTPKEQSFRHVVRVVDNLQPALPGTPGVCRSCGKPILWLDTPAGAIMPLDAETDGSGNVVIVDGKAVVLKGTLFDEKPVEGARFKSHFATCPQSDKWRKK